MSENTQMFTYEHDDPWVSLGYIDPGTLAEIKKDAAETAGRRSAKGLTIAQKNANEALAVKVARDRARGMDMPLSAHNVYNLPPEKRARYAQTAREIIETLKTSKLSIAPKQELPQESPEFIVDGQTIRQEAPVQLALDDQDCLVG